MTIFDKFSQVVNTLENFPKYVANKAREKVLTTTDTRVENKDSSFRANFSGRMITCTDGKNTITFLCAEKGMLLKNNKTDIQQLQAVFDTAVELNQFVPDNFRINHFVLTEQNYPYISPATLKSGNTSTWAGFYAGKFITLNINGGNHITAHEMGHAIYYPLLAKNLFSGTNQDWGKLYNLLLLTRITHSNYDIFTINYPYSIEREFFAEFIADYVTCGDALVSKITDPKAPPEIKELGKMLFCSLRDNVFHGKVYCTKDPFPKEKSSDLLAKLTPEYMKNVMISGLKGNNSKSYIVNITNHPELLALMGINKTDIIKSLAKQLYDPNVKVRLAALEAIQQPGFYDKSIEPLLLDLIKDKNQNIQCAALKTIQINLDKINGDIFESPLRSAIAQSTDIFTRREAISALIMIKKATTEEMIKFLNDPNSNIREAAVTKIGAMKSVDPSVLKVLLTMTYDPDEYVRRAVRSTTMKLSSDPSTISFLMDQLRNTDNNIKIATLRGIYSAKLDNDQRLTQSIETAYRSLSKKDQDLISNQKSTRVSSKKISFTS